MKVGGPVPGAAAQEPLFSMERLRGKIVIVTGAGRGIGRAIALRCAREGAAVGVNYLANADTAGDTVREIEAMGRRALPLRADVRAESQVRAMVREARQTFGRIDVWINNAGVEHEQPIGEIDEASWDDTFAVNVKGLFFCSRAAAEAMRPQGGGAIVNIASRFGFIGDPASLPYGASKAAVINLTKALAKLYAPEIRVNAVAPAYTETDMMAHVTPEYTARVVATTPLRRVARPEDTAAAVVFLASAEAGFTTGQTLLVDGGYTLK